MDIQTDLRNIRNQSKGRWLTYHVGYLPRDKRFDPYVGVIARELRLAEERKECFLMQKREGDMQYNYMVRWRKK